MIKSLFVAALALSIAPKIYARACASSLDENHSIAELAQDVQNVVDDRQTSKLFEAVDECKLAAAKKAVEKGADVNGRNSHFNGQTDRYSVLHLAVKRGCHEVAAFLLEKGAQVDARRDIDSDTPLLLAARRNDARMIEVLMGYQADVNAQATMGRTAIDIATLNNNVAAVEQLLKYSQIKLGLTSIFDHSATAIGIAARQNHLEILRLLVNHSEQITPISERQIEGAEEKARYNNHTEALDLLSQYRRRFYP